VAAGRLAERLRPCGPVLDAKAADAIMAALAEAAGEGGWGDVLAPAAEALAPVFAASPYLAGLARRRPERLDAILWADPDAHIDAIVAAASAAPEEDIEAVKRRLRIAKGDLHLLTALCDLGGVWDLDEVTGALTHFADASLATALAAAAKAQVAAGRMALAESGAAGPIPGLFAIAMGKFGAFELNYSSDIDFSIFYEPDALPLAAGAEPQGLAVALTQTAAEVLQARTSDGYVFRVDLRLRPDPSTTPPAVPVPEAMAYYQSVGQNWERAAFIKARAAAGDIAMGRAFLDELSPFVWRRNLDFAAIDDIHSIKRQIHGYRDGEALQARGADVKLGPGGIREIEFFVQTQQLILGGRDPSLRSNRTTDALAALARAGHISAETATALTQAYADLRALEHRAQMIGDEQTHRLPQSDPERRRIAALSGQASLAAFDAGVARLLRGVSKRCQALFAEDEDLSSPFGSLVFTGVEDDPETLRTLTRMGFDDAARVSSTIRAWHHGRIPATRSERGRELFTRLAPQLLEAVRATGAADVAFARFADFLSGLSAGVQVQSLFLAQPKLFELIVKVMAIAPQLAATLARRPAVLDAMLDRGFFSGVQAEDDRVALSAALNAAAPEFEAAMDAVRRAHREQSFRIGVQLVGGTISAADAGKAFADLADACIGALAAAALAEARRIGGDFPGAVAVVALGKCGSREMTWGSDLDLMTFYRAASPTAVSGTKGWAAETFYGRFTQRLIAALSAPTREGGLYEVDMRLRPSGSQGPVAVSQAAFETYYAGDAETWELLALTRARVVWADDAAFAGEVAAAIETALRRPRDASAAARDVRDMRALMARERPASGFWDSKLAAGGLVDVEFAAQYLQIVHAGAGGPLRVRTTEALMAMAEAGLAPAAPVRALIEAWRLQQDVTGLLKVTLADEADPSAEPKALKAALARAGGVRGFAALPARIRAARAAVLKAFDALVPKA
jgi:glutamate-ammonia-ligase adenylyltransferase